MNIHDRIKSIKILPALVIFIFLSISYLSWIEFNQRNLTGSQDWWSIYFKNPKINTLDFVIENKAAPDTFTWEIFLDEELFTSGSEEIGTNRKKLFDVKNIINKRKPSRVVVEVKKGSEKKTLYKNY